MLFVYYHFSIILFRCLTTAGPSQNRSRGSASPAGLLLGRFLLLLGLDALHVSFNLVIGQHLHAVAGSHDRDFDVLGAGLDDLQQRLDCQLDCLLAVHVVLVVAFEEFADRLTGSANGVGFPTRSKLICEQISIDDTPYFQRATDERCTYQAE